MSCEVWKKLVADDGRWTDAFAKINSFKHTRETNATMRVRASSTAVLLLALVAITLNRVRAYPIIAEIDEDDETVCHLERARMTKSRHHTSVSVGTGNVWDRRPSDIWAAPLHMCSF